MSDREDIMAIFWKVLIKMCKILLDILMIMDMPLVFNRLQWFAFVLDPYPSGEGHGRSFSPILIHIDGII
jgi:hypothetical protein